MEAPYLKILLDEEIVGGMLLILKEPGHMMLGRIFIHPDHQNKGIGTRAVEYIEEPSLLRKVRLREEGDCT